MRKIFMFAGCLLLCSGLHAQNKRSIVDIDRELTQATSTATIVSLLENLAETPPQTTEEVSVLGRLLDKYPAQGQRSLAKITNPKLAKAIMSSCDRQARNLKNIREKGEDNLTDSDRQIYLNSYMSSVVAIDTVSRLKNKDVVPYLKNYLADENLSRPASMALGRLGDSESLNKMLDGIGRGNPVDLSAYGDKGLSRVIEELGKPGVDSKRKDALLNQIKGNGSPERKRILKDLALNHKDVRIRDRAGLALLNSIMVNPEPGDTTFISEWIDKTKNDEMGYWAVSSIRVANANGAKALDKNMSALLVNVFRTSTYPPTRSEAVQSLGIFKIKESLPYLNDCVVRDVDSHLRGNCLEASWKISGEILPNFHPDDVKELEADMNNPRGEKIFSALRKDDPVRLFHDALKKAFNEYRRGSK